MVLIAAGILVIPNMIRVSSIEGALNKSKIQNVEVLESFDVEHGHVVFFSSNNNLEVAILKKKFFGWEVLTMGGGVSFTDESGLNWSFMNLDGNGSNLINLFLAIVTNPQITQVEVKSSKGPLEQANIIKTPQGRISYILYNQPQLPPAQIKGLSEDGKIIYEY